MTQNSGFEDIFQNGDWGPLNYEVCGILGGGPKALAASAVYGRIWRYQQGDKGFCHASIQTIADELHIGRTTVWRAIKLLKKHGLLKEIGGKDRQPKEYLTVPVEEATVFKMNTDCVQNGDSTVFKMETQDRRKIEEEKELNSEKLTAPSANALDAVDEPSAPPVISSDKPVTKEEQEYRLPLFSSGSPTASVQEETGVPRKCIRGTTGEATSLGERLAEFTRGREKANGVPTLRERGQGFASEHPELRTTSLLDEVGDRKIRKEFRLN